eukprot:UN11660
MTNIIFLVRLEITWFFCPPGIFPNQVFESPLTVITCYLLRKHYIDDLEKVERFRRSFHYSWRL